MSQYTASIRIDASAAEAGARVFAAATEAIKRGLDQMAAGVAAQAAGGRSIDQTTEALWRFKRAQDAINSASGVTGRSDSAARAADMAAYGNEIDRLRGKYVPLYAEQRRYLDSLREIRDAQKAGALTAAEAGSAIARQKEIFAAQTLAMKAASDQMRAAGESTGYMRNQALTLQYTLSDITASLASGASPFTILMQQGPQVAQAFTKAAGGPGVLAAAISALTSPIMGAVVALGALAAVTVSAFARASDLSKEQRVFAGELQATGRQAELTTKQLHGLVEAMRDANVSKDDARAAISTTLRTPGLSSTRVAQISAMTPDAAVGLGTDAASAAAALAKIAAEGYPAIERFAMANNALDAAQLKVIRGLAQQGDQVGAVDKALSLLSQRYQGLADGAMSSTEKAMLKLGRAWTGFVDAVASSAPVMNVINNLAGAVGFMANLVGGSSPASEKTALAAKIAAQRQVVESFADGTAPRDLTAFGRESDYYYARRGQQAGIDLRKMEAQMRFLDPLAGQERRMDLRASRDGGDQAAGSSYARLAQETELQKAQEALERRQRVLAASPANRPIAQARADVEARTDLAGSIDDAGSEKGRAAIIAEKEARAQLAAVVRDQTAAVNANVAGNLAAADAYQKSAAAGIEADARRQASTEALTQAINVNIRTREILAEKLSAELVAASQQLESQRNEVVNAERLADAQKKGASAYAETELAIKQQTATQSLSVAIQVAERQGLSDLAKALSDVKTEREEQIASIDRANKATQQSIDLRKADQEVALARQGAASAQIIDPSDRRAAEIAIERQREMNRLLEDGKKTTDEIGQLMERWDLKTAANEQARFWADVRQSAEGVSKDVSGFLTDGVVSAVNGGKSTFKDLWDTAFAGGKRFFARIAATALEQKIILPIAMQVVGGIPQAFGISLPGGSAGVAASGGSGGGFSLPGFGGGGSAFSGITDRINDWGARVFGTASSAGVTGSINAGLSSGQAGAGIIGPGISGSVPGAGVVGDAASASGLSGAGGTTLMQYGGAALAGIGGVMQLMNAKSTGGVVSGVSSLASAALMLNPVTAPFAPLVALGGNLLGSMFGGKKPSVGPGGGMEFGVGADGKAIVGITHGDNGYDATAQNLDAANEVGAAAKAFAEKLGGVYRGTAIDTKGGHLGSNTKKGEFTGGDSFGSPETGYNTVVKTLVEAQAAALAGVLKNSVIEGLSKPLSDRVKAASTAADFEQILQYVEGLRAVTKSFTDWKVPLSQVEVTVNGLKAAFEQAKAAAAELGLATEPVTQSYKTQLAFITDQFNAPLRERELRATGNGQQADLFAFDRQAFATRRDAAALGAEAIAQAERTLAAERTAIVQRYAEEAQAAERAATERVVSGLQAQYDSLAQELASVTQTQADDIRRARDVWKGLASDITRMIDSLKIGRLSPMSPEAQMREAQSQFQSTLTRARAGDETAAADLSAKATQALEATQGFYANGQPYAEYFNEVQTALEGVKVSALAQVGAADRQLGALTGIQTAARDSVTIQREMTALLEKIRAAQQAGSSGSTAAAINQAYISNLGRTAEAGGSAFWQAQVTNGASINTVTNAIATSDEAKIVGLYQSVLGRAPDAAGLAYWQNQLKTSSFDSIRAGFEKTPEALSLKRFAGGGDHWGGARLVGERGAELEATGPARYWSFDQTRSMLSGGASNDNSGLISAMNALGAKLERLIGISIESGAGNLDGLDAVRAELAELRRRQRLAEVA